MKIIRPQIAESIEIIREKKLHLPQHSVTKKLLNDKSNFKDIIFYFFNDYIAFGALINHPNFDVSIYVKPLYRKLGIGTYLALNLEKFHKPDNSGYRYFFWNSLKKTNLQKYYYNIHTHCPQCSSEVYCDKMEILDVQSKDTNHKRCLKCGWNGIVDDLGPVP